MKCLGADRRPGAKVAVWQAVAGAKHELWNFENSTGGVVKGPAGNIYQNKCKKTYSFKIQCMDDTMN